MSSSQPPSIPPVVLSDQQRLQLNDMIRSNNVEDQTALIRQLKHSEILQKNINKLLSLKNTAGAGLDEESLHLLLTKECSFLYTYYTDIYNKIRKDEIDLTLLNLFLNVLRNIEEGVIDQHEGSFQIGTLLKDIYVDSALKKAAKLNAASSAPVIQEEKVSWKEFKNTPEYYRRLPSTESKTKQKKAAKAAAAAAASEAKLKG
jgi:hypothetical protein